VHAVVRTLETVLAQLRDGECADAAWLVVRLREDVHIREVTELPYPRIPVLVVKGRPSGVWIG
jgi:hypothetical protein